ncbi:prepilin peptidase [Desulfoscipio gibsoniae]
MKFIIKLLFITGLSVAGAINDVKDGFIPKWVTVPLFLSGIAYHMFYAGWSGFISSLIGSILFLLYLFFLCEIPRVVLPWAGKKLSSGDHKLALSCGAWVGQQYIIFLMAAYSITFALFKIIIYVFTVKQSGDKLKNRFISDIKAELYGWGAPHREAFALYIVVPFLLTMYLLYFYRGCLK